LPLLLPNLDDLRWKDLVAEGRSLIPSSTEEWTNHNPSDPGITLIELFAYVSGMLTYQLNLITDTDVAQFLSLINGPGWKHEDGLPEKASIRSRASHLALEKAAGIDAKRRAVGGLSTVTRAVTPNDFELLARSVEGIARAICLPRRNLENQDSAVRWLDAPGHVSVAAVPVSGARPTQELLAQIRQTLEPARLLTTRLHVVPPRYVRVGLRLAIVPARNVHADDAFRNNVVKKLTSFLDPLRGWFDGTGWPFGRDLHVSELYQLLGKIPGIESISSAKDSQGIPQDEILVDNSFSDRIVRNPDGRIQAVSLLADELFDPHIEARNITIARPV
jgi:Baseplate J-like protein